MSAPVCEMLCHSASQHLQQLYTGFFMLHSEGRIRLKQKVTNSARVGYANNLQHLQGAAHAHLDVVMNGSIRIHFDTHDSAEIADKALDDCDWYFKRSYASDLVARLAPSRASRVFPLGLNYSVYPNEHDFFAAIREIRLGSGIARSLRRALDTRNYFSYVPRLRDLETLPDYSSKARVLFLAATHEPDNHPERSREKAEERREINEAVYRRFRPVTLRTRELSRRGRDG